MKDRLLEQIKGLVELYNELPNVEKVSVVPTSLVEDINNPLEKEEEVNTTNYVVCRYNANEIGIFKKFTYKSDLQSFNKGTPYNAGYFYESVLSDDIAVSTTHEGYSYVERNYDIGSIFEANETKYLVTCVIREELNFEDVRKKYYSDYALQRFNYGKSTQKEIADVLFYVKQRVEEKNNNKLSKVFSKNK